MKTRLYILEVELSDGMSHDVLLYPNAEALREAINARMTQKIGEVAVRSPSGGRSAILDELSATYREYQKNPAGETDDWNCTINEHDERGPSLYVSEHVVFLAQLERVEDSI